MTSTRSQAPTADALALYADFPACPPLPTAIPFAPVEGMVVPDGTVVIDVVVTGPITAATGFVDLTPLQVRDLFADREDVEVVHLEDEGFEAEVLVDRAGIRTFVKASIRCRTGSVVAAVVADGADAGALPIPAGTAGATTAPQ